MFSKGKFSLDEAMVVAEEARSYARSQIIKGGTHVENNTLSEVYFDSLVEGTEKQVRAEIKLRKQEKLLLDPNKNYFLAGFESVIEVTSKFSLGNCFEMAVQALNYVLNSKTEINAELYSIRGGDHAILVLNRNRSSHPSSPSTWGEQTVICDPWSNKIYPISKYKEELKNFYRTEVTNGLLVIRKNVLEEFDVTKHKLRPHKYFNVDYIRELREGERLKKEIVTLKVMFLEESGKIKKILTDYKEKLMEESEKLAKKYDDKNTKALTLSHLASSVDIFIAAIQEIENNLPLKQYGVHYYMAKEQLGDKMKRIYQLANHAITLSPAEKTILYAHRAHNSKTTLLKLFRVPTTTEKNLENIFDEVYSLLVATSRRSDPNVNTTTSSRKL